MTEQNEARYYAAYNATAIGPAPVAAWYDAAVRTDINYENPGFLRITEEQWNERNTKYWAVDNNSLVEYKPQPAVVPLKYKATSALSTARTYIYNNYGILNEDTPADWVIYIKALMAISNGTDTASTVLPNSPITNTGTSTPTASTTTATTSTATTTS